MRSNNRSRLRLSSALSAPTAAGRAMTTKSQSICVDVRNASRAMRFRRFRSTARFATRFEMASPKRARPNSLRRASIVKYRSEDRIAPAKTRSKSLPVTSRWSTGKRLSSTKCPTTSGAVAERLRTEASASFGSTSIEHLATTAGSHARTKSMRSFAFQSTRLKCSFHVELRKHAARFPKCKERGKIRFGMCLVNRTAAPRDVLDNVGRSVLDSC